MNSPHAQSGCTLMQGQLAGRGPDGEWRPLFQPTKSVRVGAALHHRMSHLKGRVTIHVHIARLLYRMLHGVQDTCTIGPWVLWSSWSLGEAGFIMSEHGSDSELSVSREHAGIRKWQSKLIAKANTLRKRPDKAAEQARKLDDELSDFFRPSPAPSPSTTQTSFEHASPPRRPAPAKADQAGRVTSKPTTAQSAHSFERTACNRRRARGLHVTFTTAEPVIIGEGGDEADLPTKDILRSYAAATVAGQQSRVPAALAYATGSRAAAPASATPAVYDDGSGRPFPLRSPMGVPRKPVATLKERRAAMEAEEGTAQTGIQASNSLALDAGEQLPDQVLPISNVESSSRSTVVSAPQRITDIISQEPQNGTIVESPSSNPSSSSSMRNGDMNSLYSTERQTKSSRSDSSPRSRPSDDLHFPLETTSTSLLQNNEYLNLVSQNPYEESDKRHSIDLDTGHQSNILHGNKKLDDFYSCTQHWHHLFRLPETQGQSITYTTASLLRTCLWWFLKGKNSLEGVTRNEGLGQRTQPGISNLSTHAVQIYVDLAKAWWLINDVIPNDLPQSERLGRDEVQVPADGLEDTTVNQLYGSLKTYMNAYDMHLQNNRLLPPKSLTLQGEDTRVFVIKHALPAGIVTLTAGVDPRTYVKHQLPGEYPFFGILLGDTSRHFSYGRIFVEAQIHSSDDYSNKLNCQCILSILRERSSSWIEATMVSQDAQIDIHIQADKRKGPTWDNVEWDHKSRTLHIHLSGEVRLSFQLSEPDFRMLWSSYRHNCCVKKVWNAKEGEETILDVVLEAFHYIAPPNIPSTFPSKPVKYCRARLFEKTLSITTGIGQRKKLIGHRLGVITPSNTKSLNIVSQDLDQTKPLLFSYLRGEGNLPALLLDTRSENQRTSLILTFHETLGRKEFHSLLDDSFVRPEESTSLEIKLHSFSIAQPGSQSAPASSNLPIAPGLQWQQIKIVNKGSFPEHSKTVLSDSLRVCMTCNYGTITDRLNLGMVRLLLQRHQR